MDNATKTMLRGQLEKIFSIIREKAFTALDEGTLDPGEINSVLTEVTKPLFKNDEEAAGQRIAKIANRCY